MLKKLKNKKILLLILILSISTIAVTYALFFSSTDIVNKFHTLTYYVTLEEEFHNDWGTKKVVIKNNDENANLLLRINYIEYWEYFECMSDEEDCPSEDILSIPLSNTYNNVDVATKGWTKSFENDFKDGNDGYYYYEKIFKPNSSVEILETINFNDELIKDNDLYNKYSNADYELTFGYEAIQATEKAAKKLWDKDITINGDNVEWK